MATVKKAKLSTVKCIRLNGVKMGRKNVYLEASEGNLSIGPTGPWLDPLDLCRKIGKSEARKLRKQLRLNNHFDILRQSLPVYRKQG